jgi:uncharacterized protein YndB with AHSA1/START domain
MASVTINAPADKVWNALTQPAQRKKWFFGVDTKTDWKVGSPIVHSGEFNGKPYTDKGVVKELEPRKRLVHTHWSSMSGRPDQPENYETITYTLREQNGATEVAVAEDNVASDEQRKTSEKMWSGALAELKKVTEGGVH